MFARTRRLTLRPYWPEDAPALFRAIAHVDVATRLARLPWPYDLSHAEDFVSRPGATHDAGFAILSHESDYPHIVGGIALEAHAGAPHELGYWLTPAVWGRGYATEAARAVLDAAATSLAVRHVQARYHLDNPASGRVLAKLGFHEIGREATYSMARGCEVECAVMARDLAAGAEPMPIAA